MEPRYKGWKSDVHDLEVSQVNIVWMLSKCYCSHSDTAARSKLFKPTILPPNVWKVSSTAGPVTSLGGVAPCSLSDG